MHKELNINDHRAQLLNQLLAYQPTTTDEREQQQNLLTFVQQEPNCFSRQNQYGHITGSAWIVDETGRKTLLTLHRKLGLWLQLGGHADGESDVMAVALREAREESGVSEIVPLLDGIFDLDVHEVPAIKQDPAHLHFDVRYLFQIASSHDLQISDESIDLQWFDMSEVANLNTDHSVLRMVQKWHNMEEMV